MGRHLEAGVCPERENIRVEKQFRKAEKERSCTPTKLRPYASNAAAVGESFMRVLLSLLSLSISPQFPVVLGILGNCL